MPLGWHYILRQGAQIHDMSQDMNNAKDLSEIEFICHKRKQKSKRTRNYDSAWGSHWRVAEYATPKYYSRSFRTCHLKTAASVFWLFWAVGSWKPANAQRGFLWTSLTYLPKVRHATGTQRPQIRFWEFHQPGKMDSYHGRGDWKPTATHTNYHASLHCSKGSFIIPESHLLSPKRTTSLLSFAY